MHTNAIAQMLVTTPKTILKLTQTLSPMETIRTILYYVLYAGIMPPLIFFLLATIIADIRQLGDWAKGQEEGKAQMTYKVRSSKSQNP